MGKKILAWAQRNERHLGAIVFIGGFITDVVTFVLLDISLVNLVFAGYLVLAAVAILLGHFLASHPPKNENTLYRSALVISPLVAQYLIGNLLSGFLIFYTKSSVLFASWPFLVLILIIFVGNEWFRKYKDRIAFIAVLFFFTVYAYAIFALPLFLGRLGPWVFVGSTALALSAFTFYMLLLRMAGNARLTQSITIIRVAVVGITIALSVSYFTGLVPPIPLSLKEGAIYHDVRVVNGTYELTGEDMRPWWDIRPQKVQIAPGQSLFAFASVFAPVRFGATVVHRWQYYDPRTKSWITQSRIAFPITGGRLGGYRGYSEISTVSPGEWRVRVETENGQVIGQMRFTVERVTTPLILHEETR